MQFQSVVNETTRFTPQPTLTGRRKCGQGPARLLALLVAPLVLSACAGGGWPGIDGVGGITYQKDIKKTRKLSQPVGIWATCRHDQTTLMILPWGKRSW